MRKDLERQVQEWLNGFPSESPVVVIPVYNAYEDVVECIESILTTTPSRVPILVIDDASTDERVPYVLSQLSQDGRFLYVRKSTNSGFVGTVNLAFAWSAPRDVIVVNSDVVVPREWLERLRAAAYCLSTVATATPLTNRGTIVSVPYRNQPIERLTGVGEDVNEIDSRVRAHSLRLYPFIPTAVGHCVYFRRSALDVVGYFDEAFAPGYGEEVDFSQRAVMAGFYHVVADDLFVYHKGARSFDPEQKQAVQRIRDSHEQIIHQRYPWYRNWTTQAADETRSSLSLALERAQLALLGCRVAIDATCLGGPMTGTQVYLVELISAMATTPARNASLFVIVPDNIRESELFGIDQLVDGVLRPIDFCRPSTPYFHLVHRPFQIRRLKELAFLRSIAERVVISQLDFIAFSNPAYAVSPKEWADYREATQWAFNIADGIIFNSQEVAQEAAQLGFYIDPNRACVIPLGTDHRLTLSSAPPTDYDRLPSPPFILVLGTSFLHKNRLYALKLLEILINKYNWRGKLVFSGATPSSGGSEATESLFLQNHPEVQPYVRYLGPVSQAEKIWLLQNAALVLCPSTREGFGLVPFEAASLGTPALTARISAFSEILGDEVIYLETFDPERGAEVVWSFLNNPEMQNQQVRALQKRAAMFSWKTVAAQKWSFYERILNMPPRFTVELPHQPSLRVIVPVAQPDAPLALRAIRRIAHTFRVCAEEWGRLFSEARQYLRFLYAQRLTRSQGE